MHEVVNKLQVIKMLYYITNVHLVYHAQHKHGGANNVSVLGLGV